MNIKIGKKRIGEGEAGFKGHFDNVKITNLTKLVRSVRNDS